MFPFSPTGMSYPVERLILTAKYSATVLVSGVVADMPVPLFNLKEPLLTVND